MERTITCAEYLLGLSMTLSSFSISVAKQSADSSALVLGVIGIILLLYSLKTGLDAGIWGRASIAILSLIITAGCAWHAATIHAPRALLVALPVSLSISTISLVLLFRS